jgi:hypothetical protein
VDEIERWENDGGKNWLVEAGRKAEERLRAMDPSELGPAGQLLIRSIEMNEGSLVSRCEWCQDEVWSSGVYYESSGYVFHEECEEDLTRLLEQAKRYENGRLVAWNLMRRK